MVFIAFPVVVKQYLESTVWFESSYSGPAKNYLHNIAEVKQNKNTKIIKLETDVIDSIKLVSTIFIFFWVFTILKILSSLTALKASIFESISGFIRSIILRILTTASNKLKLSEQYFLNPNAISFIIISKTNTNTKNVFAWAYNLSSFFDWP